MFPINFRLCDRMFLVLSGGKKLRIKNMPNMITASKMDIFAVSYRKKSIAAEILDP